MKSIYRLCGVICAAFLLLTVCLITLIAHAAPSAPTTATVDSEEMPMVGFVADGDAVNAADQSGEAPSLAVRPNSSEPWVALVQNNQIIVSKFVSATRTWVQQGSALNLNFVTSISHPTLDFVGANPSTLWVVWHEAVSGTRQLSAAWFDGNQWVQTAGLGTQNGTDNPALAAGNTVTDNTPLPWVAATSKSGVIIRRAVTDTTAQGGYRWQQVGDALRFSDSSPTYPPDLIFSGVNQSTPWVVWGVNPPTTTTDPSFRGIFASRAISDATALNGYRWENVGRQAPCQTADTSCFLGLAGISALKIASGMLTGETSPTPWIAFEEHSPSLPFSALGAIRVFRLDIGNSADPSDDRFIPVGGAVNTQCLERDGLTSQNGTYPDIYFVGNVPHVAWIENMNGLYQLLVCHLADARPGQERWDWDTITPVNRQFNTSAALPSLGSNGTTPYVAWQEAENPSNIFVAHRTPDGPAWGRNYPPFIRTISWSRNLVGQVFATDGIERALAVAGSTRPFTLTTSCDHVNGWEHIKEIHFKVANAKMTAFLGKYVAASNQVFIENPKQPGVFLGGFQPGVGQPVETSNVTFYVDRMRVRPHGAGSAVLDIDWVMSFKEPLLFQDVKQMINIVYDDGQSTGFFETGLLSFDYRIYLPVVTR